jgi:pimeloyl-ACP methyl ester carboxylesterase
LKNIRKYGEKPFCVVVIHGGPGAGGEMAPVARKLAHNWGVLEPIQTESSLNGQLEELKEAIENHGEPPIILVGYSWGAWLSFIFAARNPTMMKKLVLVGSGPFEEKYVEQLQATRDSRRTEKERREYGEIIESLNSSETETKDELLSQLGALASKTDIYDVCDDELQENDKVGMQGSIFQKVWFEAVEMRKSGELLKIGKQIKCPVIAFHGDYDPHPSAGVEKPLSDVIDDFRFQIIEKCGHTPWRERQAKDVFFRVLQDELQ